MTATTAPLRARISRLEDREETPRPRDLVRGHARSASPLREGTCPAAWIEAPSATPAGSPAPLPSITIPPQAPLRDVRRHGSRQAGELPLLLRGRGRRPARADRPPEGPHSAYPPPHTEGGDGRS